MYPKAVCANANVFPESVRKACAVQYPAHAPALAIERADSTTTVVALEDGSCPPLCPRDVCGIGFELAFVLPLVMVLRKRMRSR